MAMYNSNESKLCLLGKVRRSFASEIMYYDRGYWSFFHCLSMFHKATEESAWRRVFGNSNISSTAETLILAFFFLRQTASFPRDSPTEVAHRRNASNCQDIVRTNCPQWQWIKPISNQYTKLAAYSQEHSWHFSCKPNLHVHVTG